MGRIFFSVSNDVPLSSNPSASCVPFFELKFRILFYSSSLPPAPVNNKCIHPNQVCGSSPTQPLTAGSLFILIHFISTHRSTLLIPPSSLFLIRHLNETSCPSVPEFRWCELRRSQLDELSIFKPNSPSALLLRIFPTL